MRNMEFASFVRSGTPTTLINESPKTGKSETQWNTIEVNGIHISNVYHSPSAQLGINNLPKPNGPTIITCNFNCAHSTWGYNRDDTNGKSLLMWAETAGLQLLYDPKEPNTFFSARWDTTTNPDLAFAQTDLTFPLPTRRVIEQFPRTSHRPSVIISSSLIYQLPFKPVLRWNLQKANWPTFTKIIEKNTKKLPNPTKQSLDRSYKAFCDLVIKAAKRSIPRGRR